MATVKSPKQRDRFLTTITKKLESDRKAWQLYQQRLKELENMAARLRGLTARAIHNAQAW